MQPLLRIYWLKILITILALAGAWQIGQGAYIHAKALLAQHLLESSWRQTLMQGAATKPWSWADTWPIARLQIPQHNVDLIVLAGDSGRTLAFGPGHRFGTAAPGDIGNSVISGHRDTHFDFMKNLTLGEVIRLQSWQGDYKYFQVTGAWIINSENAKLPSSENQPMLTLVTCYPFDAIEPGGPLRYVVFAEEVKTEFTLL
jgi:sortase A